MAQRAWLGLLLLLGGPGALAVAAETSAPGLTVVVASPEVSFAVGRGAGGLVLRSARVYVLPDDQNGLVRRPDLERLLPDSTYRLDGDDAGLVVHDHDGIVRTTLKLAGTPATVELPPAMHGAERVLVRSGRPVVAMVADQLVTGVIRGAVRLAMPAGATVEGTVAEVTRACQQMTPRSVAELDGEVWVSALTCRRDAPTALLRWGATAKTPQRISLPAGLVLGELVVTQTAVLVATKVDDLGTFGSLGVLSVPRGGGTPTALPSLPGRGLDPPDLVRTSDGTLWARGMMDAGKIMEPCLFRLDAKGWSRVTLPDPKLRPHRLLLDGKGRLVVHASVPGGGDWLLAVGRPAVPLPTNWK